MNVDWKGSCLRETEVGKGAVTLVGIWKARYWTVAMEGQYGLPG